MSDEIEDVGGIDGADATVHRPPMRLNRSLRHLAGGSIRDLAGGVLRSIREPTQKISVPGGDDEISQRHARAVIDLCLRAGEAMLATGASAADVVAAVLRLSNDYGLSGTHVDVTFTSITISVHRGLDEDPISVMRVVKARTTDYTRLQHVLRLVEDITSGDEPMDVDEARTQLSAILVQPHPYRRWVVTLGKAVLAAGVVIMYDVGIVLILIAAAVSALSDLITRRMAKWGISDFFGQAVAGAVITAVAVGMYWLRSVGVELPGGNRPTLIVISGIIMLLSGIALTGAARDAVDGYYVTASARGMEVIMLTLGLAVGISVTLGLALKVGIPMRIGTSLGPDGGIVLGVIGAGVIAIGFALTSYIELRVALLAAVVGGVVFAFHQAILPAASQPGLAPAIAGTGAGAIAYLTYRWMKVPEAALSMAGIIGLLPGLPVYRALYAFMDSEYGVMAALPELVLAFATGIGLAAGTTMGGYIARKNFGIDRAGELASRRTQTMR